MYLILLRLIILVVSLILPLIGVNQMQKKATAKKIIAKKLTPKVIKIHLKALILKFSFVTIFKCFTQIQPSNTFNKDKTIINVITTLKLATLLTPGCKNST